MPLSKFLDCDKCGSAYRFKYKNRILRFIMEKVPQNLWPVLMGLFYLIAFVLLCELTEQAQWVPSQFAIPDGRFKYFWGGVDGLSALSTLFKVRGRGSLLYLSFFLRVPDEHGWISNAFVSIAVIGLVAFNVINLFRDLYMYTLWISIQCTTPLSFVESSLQQCRPQRRTRARPLQILDESLPAGHQVLQPAAAGASPAETVLQELEEVAVPLENSESSALPEDKGEADKEPLSREAPTDLEKSNELQKNKELANSRTCECICCLDSPARFVAESCGHLVTCKVCKKRLIYKQLVQLQRAGLPKMRDLGQEMMQGVAVPCPICRTEGELVYVQHYKGEVFFP